MRIRVLSQPAAMARRSTPAVVVSAMVAVVAAILLVSRPAWSDDFVLIRNAKNPATSISSAEAKEMAIGKRKVWPGGAVVGLVLTQPGSGELRWFASRVCGVADMALMAKIKQEVFKGELRKPVIVTSDKDTIAAVAADEGAMGIVPADAVKSLPATVAVLALK